MNKLLIFILVLSVNAACFAQSNQTESLTISTYYPSPYGVYRNLKLNPSTEPVAGVGRGVMYFDDLNDTLRIYNRTGWVNVTGGGASAGDILVYASHTVGDCTTARGTPVSSGTSFKICRFALPACPAGWIQYLGWSDTTAKTCTATGPCCSAYLPSKCSVGGHPWSNVPTEHCTYNGASVYCGQYHQYCNSMNTCYGCGYNYLECPCVECYATVNAIGCY